jgi:hypothetical protein
LSRREKLFWLCAGAALIVLVFSLVPTHYDICDAAEKSKEERCTPYQVVPFVSIKVAQILDKAGGIITALATIAIALFTFTLKRATDKLWDAGERQLELLTTTNAAQSRDMRESIRVGKTAADAAALSARAAVALELPVIRVEPGRFVWGKSSEGDQPETEYFDIQWFDLANLGRTNAYPIEIRWGWFVGDKLPDTPIYVFRKPFDIDAILKPEVSGEIQVRSEMLLTPGDAWKILRNNTKLWLYCSLTYDYFMQTRHDAGFCWLRYETFGKGGFRLEATAPAYNRKT